jgi:uncharacterized surface protein with fasciclin (FAS1) repeats
LYTFSLDNSLTDLCELVIIFSDKDTPLDKQQALVCTNAFEFTGVNLMIRKVIIAATATFLTATLAIAAESTAPAPTGKDVLTVAKQAGTFNTLVQAIEAAGLTETLSGQGPFTVFAPTDEAFAKLPAGTVEELLKPENKDKLVKVLSYHVVAGKAMSDEDLKRTRSANTVAGAEVRTALVRGRLRVNDARVGADVTASNGVVHVIDRVLLPN